MKTICIHTVDGSIFRTKATEDQFDQKENINDILQKFFDGEAYFNAKIDGTKRYFNRQNIISIWMEDEG